MAKRNKGLEDSIRNMMHELEGLAKEVRAAIRKRAKEAGLTKNLQRAAKQLREGAAKAAAQVEKYAHSLRTELESQSNPARKRARR